MNILIVEDSRLVSGILVSEIESRFDCGVVAVRTMAEAESAMDSDKVFFVALAGLSLSDAPEGQIIDSVLKRGVPLIVLTGVYDEDTRKKITTRPIIDYVLKTGIDNIAYVITLIERLRKNRFIRVLVADDSRVQRKMAVDLLKSQNFQVLEADDGAAALNLLEQYPDTRLVITDYHMPRVNGFELTEKIRSVYHKEELAILGVSSDDDPMISARFLKFGANDFLRKDYSAEEFHIRVRNTLETNEYIEKIRNLANRDYMTGLFNRRYFFDHARPLYESTVREEKPVTLAMLDIDKFKSINDTYGHDVGDTVIKTLADLLKKHTAQAGIASRFGGEEFCMFIPEMDGKEAESHFETLRETVEKIRIKTPRGELGFTVSIGITSRAEGGLENMILRSDKRLYDAKRGGRNRVVVDFQFEVF